MAAEIQDDTQTKQLTDTIRRFEKLLGILRNELQWQAFRFNTGQSVKSCVQKQHCFVDGIHNPAATNTQVSLYEDGVLVYNTTLPPGQTERQLQLPFMRECVLLTDGNAVTIWGRIRG